jgi:hypothetical protein
LGENNPSVKYLGLAGETPKDVLVEPGAVFILGSLKQMNGFRAG